MMLASTILALLCGSAIAVGPVFWEISKQDDVIKGDARGVSIAENGTITLAPALTLVYDTKEAYIWSSATDATGTSIWARDTKGESSSNAHWRGRLLYDAPSLTSRRS